MTAQDKTNTGMNVTQLFPVSLTGNTSSEFFYLGAKDYSFVIQLKNDQTQNINLPKAPGLCLPTALQHHVLPNCPSLFEVTQMIL